MGDLKDKLPILLVLNKKDLIKPGEIAKKLEVKTSLLIYILACKKLNTVLPLERVVFYYYY